MWALDTWTGLDHDLDPPFSSILQVLPCLALSPNFSHRIHIDTLSDTNATLPQINNWKKMTELELEAMPPQSLISLPKK